jgi:hypothetical protein
MTYRIYARWAQQKVSDKTVTESLTVARFAFDELIKRTDLKEQGALGVSFSDEGKQVEYVRFDEPPNLASSDASDLVKT